MTLAHDRATHAVMGCFHSQGLLWDSCPKSWLVGSLGLLTPDYTIVQKICTSLGLASGPEKSLAPAERFPAGSQPAAKAFPIPHHHGAGGGRCTSYPWRHGVHISSQGSHFVLIDLTVGWSWLCWQHSYCWVHALVLSSCWLSRLLNPLVLFSLSIFRS